MTYIEHDRDCNIFHLNRYNGGHCNCPARYARSPRVMGPHEQHCPYLDQMTVGIPTHGICYCSANPDHDTTCTGTVCWERRKGITRVSKVA